ncbi:DinB family protein [Microscilla marina]|uniref:DinB-like domain-containing protein n=1 Tax=Microscilla marina ATCC 23134 TaxID=313606 RepID=A1ZZY1_MICM2|nr:DinB family protein [Microscilla marina]EAY24069.1 conserved hypothetical protein [Microscilla marina ATCC 23134]
MPESEKSWAGIWVRVQKKEKKIAYFDNMRDRKIRLNKWRTYMVEAEIDPSSDKIYFGGVCIGNGKFYFDNFEVLVENAQGEYQKIFIPNASFDNKVTSNAIPQWFEGTKEEKKVRVKEYTISSSETEKRQGKYALLIEGKGIRFTNYLIGSIKGYAPQIGTLITMLNNLSSRVASAVKNLSQKQIDWQEDERSNSIGALIIHLAATEAYYQVATFENREFNKEELLKWTAASSLGAKGSKTFKGKSIGYYLNICDEVRQKTLEKFKPLNDNWLAKTWNDGEMNNHFAWFHVMEHQANHLGQIYMIKKKLKQLGIE